MILSISSFVLVYILAVALIVVVLIFVIMLVFTGFLVELASVFNWLSWIQWISAFRYSSNTLTVNEFRNITFCSANFTDFCPTNGSDVLQKRALDHETDWDMWKNFFALTMMTITFLILAYIQLFRLKKNK
jgi:ATP-binding cassette, subfamily G (WHITE), member 2